MTWQAKRTTHYISGRFTDDEPTLGVENPAPAAAADMPSSVQELPAQSPPLKIEGT